MRGFIVGLAASAALFGAAPAHAQILKSATTLAPGSLMLALAPVYVFHRNRPQPNGVVMAMGCVGLIEDFDLVFQAGIGVVNFPPYVGGRVEAPLVQDQSGQPGVTFGLGAHWGYPSGYPAAVVSKVEAPVPGVLSFDAVMIVSEGFGNFVVHGALGYSFVAHPSVTPLALGIVSLGGQYSFTPRISLLVEGGFNASPFTEIARYVSVALVFYAL